MPEILLTNYTELLAAGADWLNRADLTDQLPSFVVLAEAQLNREMRVRDMMVRAYTTSQAENVALPDDWLEHYSLVLAGGPPGPPLRYMSEGESNDWKARATHTGQPMGYTVIGNMIELVPAPGADVELRMVYFAKIPALKTAVDGKNWLLTKSPDLYLFATLMQAAPYLKDDERLMTWAQHRTGILEGIRLESEAALRPRAGMVARVRAF